MSAKSVTLVVHVPDEKERLVPTVRWVDRLDLPYPDYQVIYLARHNEDAGGRLATLTERRPNVLVIGPDDDGSVLDRAEGEYLLVAGSEDRVQPWGLRALLDRAHQTSADLVLGRSTANGPIGFVPEVLRRPWNAGDAAIASLAPVALIRTELLRTVRAAAPVADSWRTLRVRVLNAASGIEVVTDRPIANGAGPGAGETTDEVWADVDDAAPLITDPAARAIFLAAHAAATLRRTPESEVATRITEVVRRHVDPTAIPEPGVHPTADVLRALLDGPAAEAVAAAAHHVRPQVACNAARWEDGRLHLTLTVTVSPVGGARPAPWTAEVTPDLLLRHPGSSAVYPVVTSVQPTASGGDKPSFTVEATIDPATAAAGGPLVLGQWHLLVRLLGTDSDGPATSTVPFTDPGPAVVDGVPVKPYAEKGFRLDVGATKHGIFGGSTVDDSTVRESAAGSLLTVRLPKIAVRGDARIPGQLLLGKFGLPSYLITDADGARLECYVSGLASASPLSGHYPPAVSQPLGLTLRIGPAGNISVEPPPKKKPAAPKKPAPPKKPAGKTAPDGEPAAQPASPEPKATAKPSPEKPGTTARDYPSAAPSMPRRLTDTLRPAADVLPTPVKRRVRQAYRKLTK